MATLTVADVIRKTGRVAPCPRCEGKGREGVGMARRPCGCCDGKGSVRVLESAEWYQATQGTDVLDAGGPLDALIENVLPTLQFMDGDVLIWRHAEHRGPQAVAVLTLGADGPVVRWL